MYSRADRHRSKKVCIQYYQICLKQGKTMNCFYLLVLLMCCSCQNQTDCANWNERRDVDRQQETRTRDVDCNCRNGDRVQSGCGCENDGWTGQSGCSCQRENAAGMQRRNGDTAGPMSEQPDCGCQQQMLRQGGMQRYDRELKESAGFDSVPGMEMTDGHPYPVYRETDEVR